MTPVHPTMLFILPADPSGAASQPSHHPLMTATLAGVALYAGANVKIIDALLDDLSLAQMTAKAKAISADWIGIISYEYRRELPSEVSLDVATALRNELPSTAIGVLNCPREERELERATVTCGEALLEQQGLKDKNGQLKAANADLLQKLQSTRQVLKRLQISVSKTDVQRKPASSP